MRRQGVVASGKGFGCRRIAVMTAVAAGLVVAPSTSEFAASAWTAVAGRPTVPAGAGALGAVPAGQVMSGDVGLAPRDPAALTAFAGAVSDPRSPMYRHYMPAGGFAGTFGPARGPSRP